VFLGLAPCVLDIGTMQMIEDEAVV
jgi:hypothetical protein